MLAADHFPWGCLLSENKQKTWNDALVQPQRRGDSTKDERELVVLIFILVVIRAGERGCSHILKQF